MSKKRENNNKEVEILEFTNTNFSIIDDIRRSKKKKKIKTIVITIICIVATLTSSFLFLLYGPYNKFREWLITTAMTTMNHQYLATIFYSDKVINEVLSKNDIIENDDTTDTDSIKIVDVNSNIKSYKNKYEEEILTKDNENDLYKLIEFEGDGYFAHLVVIYDPSKIKVATTAYLGSSGQYLTTMAKENNAVVAINGSGFYDPDWNSSGGYPHGIVIKNGEIVWDAEKASVGGGIIGFTKDNKLVLGKMTAEEAIDKGIRDALEFGPFLIVNGKASFIKGNGGWGTAPRTAIGQRQDGIVLFLVIDGRTLKYPGASMVDLTEIMERYGAYNAVNLDGGTSSGLVINNELINNPVNSYGAKKTRPIPTAFIVTND